MVMSGKDRRLSSDYAWIDTKTGEVKVRGNVVFVATTWTIKAAEMHFNMHTGLGSIFYGTVSNDYYRLKGQLIRKVSANRFLTTEGEYTTCRDCPESWKLSASSVDLTMDGYAFMEDVYVVIKDVPTLYLPYLIFPVKTRRQTGFLFPPIGSGSANGFTFLQPFFLVISPYQDVTFTYGRYSKRGRRGQLQYQYKSYGEFEGILDTFYQQDISHKSKIDRYALRTRNEWPINKEIDLRWRISEATDRDYVFTFPEDVPDDGEPAMESSIVANGQFDTYFISLEGKRYRSLITRDPVKFDKQMVQVQPSVYFGVRERKLWGSLTGSLYGRYDRFTRGAGGFRDDNENGVFDAFSTDRIRRAERLQVSPGVAYSFKLADVWSIQPSATYNERLYGFNIDPSSVRFGGLSSRYVSTRVRTSVTIENVWDVKDSDETIKIKHQLTPILTYSNIPWISQTLSHPFTFQSQQPGGIFDQFDLVPINNREKDLREPLGNAISFSLLSRLIKKGRDPDTLPRPYPYDLTSPKKKKKYGKPQNKSEEIAIGSEKRWDKYRHEYGRYSQTWLLTINQAYDFKEGSRSVKGSDPPRKPYSPLLIRSTLDFGKFTNYVQYQRQPYAGFVEETNRYRPQHDLSVSGKWVIKNLHSTTGILYFRRAVRFGFSYTTGASHTRVADIGFQWSFNDYFSISGNIAHNFLTKKTDSQSISSLYNAPSQCWQISLSFDETAERGTEIGFNLGVNLIGGSFIGGQQGAGFVPGL